MESTDIRTSSLSKPGHTYWLTLLHGLPLLLLVILSSVLLFRLPDIGGVLAPPAAPRLRDVLYLLIYIDALVIIALHRDKLADLMRGRWLAAAMLLFVLTTALWSRHPKEVLLLFAHLLGLTAVAMATVLAFKGDEKNLLQTLVAASVILVPAYLAAAFYRGGAVAPFITWMGGGINDNTYGTVGILAVWANVSYIFYTKSRAMRALNVAIILGCIVMTIRAHGTLATLLSLGLAIVIPLFIQYQHHARTHSVIKWMLLGGLGMIWLVAVVGTTPELFDTGKMISVITGKPITAERATYLGAAQNAMREGAWFGWGFDGLKSVMGAHNVNDQQFHNGFRFILISGGRVALILLAWMSVSMAVRALRWQTSNRRMYVSFTMLLLALMIYSYATEWFILSPNILWLLFTLAYFMLPVDSKTALEKS